jgi:hypothetical protein
MTISSRFISFISSIKYFKNARLRAFDSKELLNLHLFLTLEFSAKLNFGSVQIV